MVVESRLLILTVISWVARTYSVHPGAAATVVYSYNSTLQGAPASGGDTLQVTVCAACHQFNCSSQRCGA